jgi:hypothetical protein
MQPRVTVRASASTAEPRRLHGHLRAHHGTSHYGHAGGSVTDRDYDTIYTERHMRTPGNNLEGYRDTAPRAPPPICTVSKCLLHLWHR